MAVSQDVSIYRQTETMTGAEATSDSDGIDRLVELATDAVGKLARRGGALITGLAIVAGLSVAVALLLGLAAFDGTAKVVWIILTVVLLLGAFVAPLVAAAMLRGVPKRSQQLGAELRRLITNNPDARRVVIDTVAVDDDASTGGPSARQPTAAAFRTQQFGQLRSFAGSEFAGLAAVFRRLTLLPAIVAGSFAAMFFGGILAFFALLVWIF